MFRSFSRYSRRQSSPFALRFTQVDLRSIKLLGRWLSYGMIGAMCLLLYFISKDHLLRNPGHHSTDIETDSLSRFWWWILAINDFFSALPSQECCGFFWRSTVRGRCSTSCISIDIKGSLYMRKTADSSRSVVSQRCSVCYHREERKQAILRCMVSYLLFTVLGSPTSLWCHRIRYHVFSSGKMSTSTTL